MKKEFTAKTVEEAKALAAAEFGVEEAKIRFEVIEEPKKGFLGIGSADARISAEYTKSKSEIAADYIKGIVERMGIEADLNVTVNEEDTVIDIVGDTSGAVIGRRGETLDSLQYLTSLVANHGKDDYLKVTIDTGNYREKREKTLEILGRKLAIKASKTGRKSNLEPMNPYERRIIHTAVQKVNGAISWSEGENANRHVVIGPDPKVRNNFRRDNYGRGRGGRRPYNANRSSHPAPVNPDRKPLNEGGENGLYGRIDIDK